MPTGIDRVALLDQAIHRAEEARDRFVEAVRNAITNNGDAKKVFAFANWESFLVRVEDSSPQTINDARFAIGCLKERIQHEQPTPHT